MYKSVVGNEACSNCPTGYTTRMEGAYYVEQCCEKIYLIKKTLVNVNCFLCPFHAFCNFIFSATCVAGYTKRNGVCVQCEAGTAKSESGDHPCTECPFGSNADRTECDGKKNLIFCFKVTSLSNFVKSDRSRSKLLAEVNFI